MAKSPKYNKAAVDKQLTRNGVVKPKAKALTHKLLKGHQKTDEAGVFSKDIVNFSMYAGMYSDGAHAFFQAKDGKRHKLQATGDRPRKYYLDGKEIAWDDLKNIAGGVRIQPQQGMKPDYDADKWNIEEDRASDYGVSDADRNPSMKNTMRRAYTTTRKPNDRDVEKRDAANGLQMDAMTVAKRKKERAMFGEDGASFSVGDTVIALKGPHKGDKHEIIHDFGDGTYNIKPLTHRVKYRMGAAKASAADLQAIEESKMNEDDDWKAEYWGDPIEMGTKVWFRPGGLWPFAKFHGQNDNRPNKAFPKSNKVTGTVVSKNYDTYTVKLDTPVEARSGNKRTKVTTVDVKPRLVKPISNEEAVNEEEIHTKKFAVHGPDYMYDLADAFEKVLGSNFIDAHYHHRFGDSESLQIDSRVPINSKHIAMAQKLIARAPEQHSEPITDYAGVHESVNEGQKKMTNKKITEGVLDDMDDDGFMAKRQLYDLAKYSVELHRMIQDTDNLEPWIQAKITKAADYIDTVKHYMEYKDVDGAADMADEVGFDDLAGVVDTMGPEEPQEEVMEFDSEYDEEEGIGPDDVLRMAVTRGVIGPGTAQSATAYQVAQGIAEWHFADAEEIGSSDVSIALRAFCQDMADAGLACDGAKAHLYESEIKAQRIYKKMLSGLRGKK